MACQRVLLLAIGGRLGESVWQDIRRWSDARSVTTPDEWSHEDWPISIRNEVDAFVERIASCAFTPPVLYRSEHVDCCSMGDVYERALVNSTSEDSRQIYTRKHEIIATRFHFKERIVRDASFADETDWLYNRVNEAIAAWGDFAEDRLILFVRFVLGALWTDEEVVDSLQTLPAWWSERE